MEVFSSRMELSGLYQESSAMSAFCQILRYNINSDRLLVTIQEELQQIHNYISIQKIREIVDNRAVRLVTIIARLFS